MKKLFCLLFVAAFCALASSSTFAQTTAVSDQKFQELINEVRQLKAELIRMQANTHRMYLLLEQQRQQQSRVVQITSQLNNTREQLAAMPSKKRTLNAELEAAEKQKEAGLVGEREVKAIKAEIEQFDQREQYLMQRELTLATELQTETATLSDLKIRLDRLDQQLATPSNEPAKKQD
jgi:hypothetical protein